MARRLLLVCLGILVLGTVYHFAIQEAQSQEDEQAVMMAGADIGHHYVVVLTDQGNVYHSIGGGPWLPWGTGLPGDQAVMMSVSRRSSIQIDVFIMTCLGNVYYCDDPAESWNPVTTWPGGPPSFSQPATWGQIKAEFGESD